MASLFRSHFAACCAAVLACALTAVGQQSQGLSTAHLRAAVEQLPPKQAVPKITPELRGDIYMARKMYREAIDMYRQSPDDSAVVQNKTGIAFHQLLQLGIAKKYYQRSIQLDPTYSEAINNLGTVAYAEKNYRKAISYYKRAIKNSDKPASVYANLGAAYFARRDYKKASDYYETALKLDPDVFEHRGGFGTLMQERTITELGLFHLYLAKTYAKSGANDRALIYLRKALEEGVKDRQKIPDAPEFVSLKKEPAFQQLLAENPKPL